MFWTWKIILSNFCLNICASPLHLEHAHQKWCSIDFIHGRRSLQFAILETLFNFCFMFLQKYQTSNWWSTFFSSYCICFLIWECLSVVNISILIFSFFNLFKTLTNANFSILCEFPAWVHCHISISMTLLLAWSKVEYVMDLVQWPGLSQRPSPLKEQAGFFLIPLIKMVLSFNYTSLITPKWTFFNVIIWSFTEKWNVS